MKRIVTVGEVADDGAIDAPQTPVDGLPGSGRSGLRSEQWP